MNTFNIISWNVAGFRPVKSLDKLFDYHKEDTSYFAEQIKNLDPDLACLQETHLNKLRSVTKEIGDSTKLKYLSEKSMHPSHIDANYNLGTAILSKTPIANPSFIKCPYPRFELKFSDGRIADRHQKYIQTISFKDFTVINIQLLPMELFGYKYHTGLGRELAIEIEECLLKFTSPLIFVGDFNYNELRIIFPKLYNNLGLKEAISNLVTRPTGTSSAEWPDHILYTPEFRLIKSTVIPTNTDHYLCNAIFSLS